MWARAVAMLAVAVQLPEPDPKATVGTTRTKRAQAARASDFMSGTIGVKTLRQAYEFLKPAACTFAPFA
jgi:hypothetical protein